MVKLFENGAYLLNGELLVEDNNDASAVLSSKLGTVPARSDAAKGTMAYSILQAHNTSHNPEQLKIKFDCLTSHDITYVGIIQTARASGLEKFPIPYVLMKMTTCLVLPVLKNTVVFMSPLIRLSSISTHVKCWQDVEK